MYKLFALIIGFFLLGNAAVAAGITPHPQDIDLPDVADQPTDIDNGDNTIP